MKKKNEKITTKELFETSSVSSVLLKMAIPAVMSQLITLVYNIADTWFIGQTNNPYMVAASSLVLTVFMMTTVLANLFGVGGGNLVVRLLGKGDELEAKKVASLSLVMAAGATLLFSIICVIFRDPILYLLGASENTIEYARQYMFFVVVIGGLPTVLANTMSYMVRNIGYSKEAGFGLCMGGVLNVILDPIFMFVICPDGYEVMGAAVATMLSNVITLVYFMWVYWKLRANTILVLPRTIEKIRRTSTKSLFSVGIPAAMNVLLFDLTSVIINRLAASHGDIELAAIGIVLKVERLPLNIGIGICLGMMPLAAYNYASGNYKRMKSFFTTARTWGLTICIICVCLYRIAAPYIISMFIADAETIHFGTEFLKARCFAAPFMFLCFHMVHFMQAIDQGRTAFIMSALRQLCLNIPILFLMNYLFGVTGIVWTQMIADLLCATISYVIYKKEIKKLTGYQKGK